MKHILAWVLIAVLGTATGVLLDMAFWEWGLPYPGLDALASIVGADGESAYDVMTLELIIQMTVLYSLAWIAFLLFRKKRTRS